MYAGNHQGFGDARPITGIIGSTLMGAGGKVLAANPLVGGIMIGVGALTTLIGSLFKPDITKIEATRIVDQIESQYLQPMLHQWQSAPTEQKTVQAQAQVLSVIDQALASVQQGCSNPALKEAGQRCISERLVKGGSAPWCPTGNGCDWITLYRDPIANDPEVHDPVMDTLSEFGASFSGSGSKLPLLLAGGLLLLVAAS